MKIRATEVHSIVVCALRCRSKYSEKNEKGGSIVRMKPNTSLYDRHIEYVDAPFFYFTVVK